MCLCCRQSATPGGLAVSQSPEAGGSDGAGAPADIWDDESFTVCVDLLARVYKEVDANLVYFERPVDCAEYPDYPTVVKAPVSLSEIKVRGRRCGGY